MHVNDDKKTHAEIVESEETRVDQNSVNNQDAEDTKIAEMQQQLNHYKDQFLRANADFQNFKRRTAKDKSEWTLIAQIATFVPLIQFFEDFDRAIGAADAGSTEQDTPWLEGFRLIQKNLKKTLSELGVEEMQTTTAFNPELHEALMQVESLDHKSGDIVEVLSNGYLFKGKVLRHAKVSVAK